MKILYVEDEIRKHKDKIQSLFEPILTKKIKRKLNLLIKDKYVEHKEIQEVLNSGNVLVVARNLMEAMEQILNHLDEFALFIVDRNLAEGVEYDYESESEDQYFDLVKKVYPKYTEVIHKKYASKQREGDYLLEYLLSKGVNCQERFFMLTANSDRLINEDYIQEKLQLETFSDENIISKDDMNAENRLKEKILH